MNKRARHALRVGVAQLHDEHAFRITSGKGRQPSGRQQEALAAIDPQLARKLRVDRRCVMSSKSRESELARSMGRSQKPSTQGQIKLGPQVGIGNPSALSTQKRNQKAQRQSTDGRLDALGLNGPRVKLKAIGQAQSERSSLQAICKPTGYVWSMAALTEGKSRCGRMQSAGMVHTGLGVERVQASASTSETRMPYRALKVQSTSRRALAPVGSGHAPPRKAAWG